MAASNPLSQLIEQLSNLPGIGPKSAQRLAYFFLSLPTKQVEHFAEVLITTKKRIRFCEQCFNISFDPKCMVCQNPNREKQSLCVVSEPKDIYAIERMGEFRGLFHVLGGLISPLDGIHPETLRIQELINRIKDEGIREIILAINPTIEGDATILYLTNLLKKLNVSISRLAYGLPIGSDIDYADDLTLRKAFQGRTSI